MLGKKFYCYYRYLWVEHINSLFFYNSKKNVNKGKKNHKSIINYMKYECACKRGNKLKRKEKKVLFIPSTYYLY